MAIMVPISAVSESILAIIAGRMKNDKQDETLAIVYAMSELMNELLASAEDVG